METQTLHASVDKMLDEHTRYALIVTRRLRDTAGNPVAPSPDFERLRRDLRETNDPDSRDYRRALLTAEWAARRSGVQNDEIAALSVFTTQSTTSLGARILAQVRRGVTPATVTFNIGPGGAPAAYTRDAIASLTWNQHTSTTGGMTVSPQPLAPLDIIPGAVGRVAFGQFESPDFMALKRASERLGYALTAENSAATYKVFINTRTTMTSVTTVRCECVSDSPCSASVRSSVRRTSYRSRFHRCFWTGGKQESGRQ